MEEAPGIGKESSHSAHGNGISERKNRPKKEYFWKLNEVLKAAGFWNT